MRRLTAMLVVLAFVCPPTSEAQTPVGVYVLEVDGHLLPLHLEFSKDREFRLIFDWPAFEERMAQVFFQGIEPSKAVDSLRAFLPRGQVVEVGDRLVLQSAGTWGQLPDDQRIEARLVGGTPLGDTLLLEIEGMWEETEEMRLIRGGRTVVEARRWRDRQPNWSPRWFLERFAATRERAYVSLMRSELRNLLIAQEAYFADHGSYAADMDALGFVPVGDATAVIDQATERGWAATAAHPRTTIRCGIAVGSFANPVDPAAAEGEPRCR